MIGTKSSKVWGLLAAAGITGSIALTAAIAAAPSAPSAAEQPQRRAGGPQVGEVAPQWQAVDADGKQRKLSDFKGKIVVMDFWATWCGPCLMAMPDLQRMHETYKDQGVAILGMNFGEKPSGDPVGYMKKQNYTYGLMLKCEEVAKAYGVSGIPAFFVIGPDGKVLYRAVGFSPERKAELERVIKANLDKVEKPAKDSGKDTKQPQKTPDAKPAPDTIAPTAPRPRDN